MPKIIPAQFVREDSTVQATYMNKVEGPRVESGRVFGILDACEDLDLNKVDEEISPYDICHNSQLEEHIDEYMSPESWYI
jgi:hypothetical protein